MLKLGLTGGIATGKSTVAAYLEAAGAHVVDADIVAHQQMMPGMPAYEDVVAYFGQEILLENEEIDRAKLGEIVFNDSEKREALNQRVHPHVIESFEQETNRLIGLETRLQKSFLFVMMIPLLFETELTHLVDQIIVVSCTAEQQLERLMKRNQLTQAEAQQRIDAQWPLSEKIKRADLIINNSLGQAETEKQVKEWLKDLRWDTFVTS